MRQKLAGKREIEWYKKMMYIHCADEILLVKIDARRFVNKITYEKFGHSSSAFLDL